MDLELTYQKVMSDLKAGGRALIRFNEAELEHLGTLLARKLEAAELEKVLCLLDHSAVDDQRFEKRLIELLASELPSGLKIYALNCCRKHVIQARFKKGQRLHFDFLEVLRKLLHASEPELVEWTLRTIEECGSQGVYFLKDFDKIKPPPWKWFNEHQRAVRELIAMLERRWSRFEKS